MDEKNAYSSPIAAEAVGERLGSPAPDAGEQTVRPVATSAGSQARVADKTAEAVGERVGDAYADATTDEARERSRKSVRRTATEEGPQHSLGAACGWRTFSPSTGMAPPAGSICVERSPGAVRSRVKVRQHPEPLILTVDEGYPSPAAVGGQPVTEPASAAFT
jgi:hypothetical protein